MSNITPVGKRFAQYAAWVTLVIVAAIPRFRGIADRELWFDENCTYYIVHHFSDWPSSGPSFSQEVGHMPYFALLHLWTRLTRESIFGMRSLSAIAGILTVIAIVRLGTWLGGRAVGWTAGILLALHPLHIYYSQEARSYAFWTLCITLALHVLCKAVVQLRWSWWAAYVGTAFLAFMTHYYTLLWFPGTAATVCLAGDRRRFWRSWSLAHVALAIACAPVVYFLVIPLSHRGARPWFHEMWQKYPPYLAVLKSLWVMLPSGGYPDTYPILQRAASAVAPDGAAWLPTLLSWGPVVLVFGLAVAMFSRPAPNLAYPTEPTSITSFKTPFQGFFFCIALSLAFLVAAFLNSAILEPTYIVGRYDLAALPSVVLALAFLIIAASDAWAARPTTRAVLRGIFTTAFCACSIVMITGMAQVPISNWHRDLARKIAATVGPDDLVVSVNKYALYVLFELDDLHFSSEIISFPPEHDRQLCWQDAEAERSDPARLREGVHAVLQRVRQAMTDKRRVWILAHGKPAGAQFEVDSRFFSALRDAQIEVRPIEDETVGLAELLPLPRGSNESSR